MPSMLFGEDHAFKNILPSMSLVLVPSYCPSPRSPPKQLLANSNDIKINPHPPIDP